MFKSVRGAKAWVLGIGTLLGVLSGVSGYVDTAYRFLPKEWAHLTPLLTIAGFACALWALGTTDSKAIEVVYRENIEHRRRIAELEKTRPRQLTPEQSRRISARLCRWPAYREEMHKRPWVLILASPAALDAKDFARQIRLALEQGGLFVDDVEDFTWGSPVENRLQFKEENRKFLALHDANVTVFGSDLQPHDGEPLHELLVEALQAGNVDVTAHVAPNQIGGQIAVVVGRGQASTPATM